MEGFNLRLIPLLPFLGAAVLFLFGRRWKRETAQMVATLAIAISCILTIDAFFFTLPKAGPGGITDNVFTWIASGKLTIDMSFRMDALSGLLCFVITFIGALIHVYSTGYMAHDPDNARFFGYLNLFCGSMLVLVLGDSLPVMFIGWEGVGLCSYLLIGFWYGETPNADAGKKAFIVNRIGDLGFLLGMFLLYGAVGTLTFAGLSEAARGTALTDPLWGSTVVFWGCLLLFVGAAGKSAQIPLYVWLPDAMAGPTPVSALIHAATMVTAGVYMVARLHFLFVLTPAAMAIVAIVGAATALFAAIIGFAQNDFKKVLAYSTVSQLGFMFAGVGTANFTGGVFHLFTHAFFKAGLFLCAGSVMHAMSGSGDITRMGGLRKKLPWTHGVFWVCWMAICGIPPFSGFFSKDSIIAGAFGSHAFDAAQLTWVGPLVGALLALAAFGTAFYMSRLYFLVFSGKETRADEHTRAHIHESPWEMVVPLVVLAAGAFAAGFFGLPGALFGSPGLNLLGHHLEPALGPEPHMAARTEVIVMVASTVSALIGILLARALYGGGYTDRVRSLVGSLPAGFVSLVRDKFRVDELYDAAIVRPVRTLSTAVFKVVDRVLIDRILVGGAAVVVDAAGRIARTFQSGDGQRYLAVFAIGAAALVVYASRPRADIKVDVMGYTAKAQARGVGDSDPLAGLRYEWDFDDDGRTDKSGPTADFPYEGSGTYTIRLKLVDPKWPWSSNTIEHEVKIR